MSSVQDMGCGVGGPARHIATFTEAEITGLNINDYQIHRARELTKAAGVDHLCKFVKVRGQRVPGCVEPFCFAGGRVRIEILRRIKTNPLDDVKSCSCSVGLH